MKKGLFSSFPAARPLSLADYFEAWAQPFLKKRGFSSSTILMYWSAIVGPELAVHTQPLRIVKDRLELKVSPAFHLDVQYMSGQIVERVNTFMGGATLKGIILKKGVIHSRTYGRDMPTSMPYAPSLQERGRIERMVKRAGLSDFSCPNLEQAFRDLATGVVSRGGKRSKG